MPDQINSHPAGTIINPELYRKLFEETLDALVLFTGIGDGGVRPSGYRVSSVNPAFKRIPGFPAEVAGKTLDELFAENAGLMRETLDSVYSSGTPAKIELYSEKLDMHLVVSVFRPVPGCVTCILRDITDRKRAEFQAQSERDRLANVLEGTNAGNWHWNVQTGELSVNDRWAAIMGYTLEELAPLSVQTWKKTTHPDDLKIAEAALDNLFRGKSNYYDVEFREKHRNGHWVWVNARGKVIEWTEEGKPLCMSGIHLDITTRKLAEQALRESEENLRVTLNSIGDAVIATNENGRVTRMNPVAERLTGWSEAEARGRDLSTIFRVVSARTGEATPNPAQRVLATGKTTEIKNHALLISRNGTRHQIADSGAPIRSFDNTVIGVVLVFRDVTREYALQEQLRQSQKMEAVGQLAGGIAHDFNNLLQAILGYGEIALEETASADMIRNSIGQMMKAGTQAKIMTGQLLAFSRRKVLEMTVMNLHETVCDLINIILRLLGEHISLEVKQGDGAGMVRADRVQISQMLTNLCVNSRDAMPEGGTITIQTSNVSLDSKFCKKNVWAQPGEFVRLSVTDTGCGMDSETLKHAFDPFFSTKEVGKGTGLGLSTVYGLVRQHDGFIRICSEPGQGTNVEIFLPAVDSETTSVCQDISFVPEGTETILVAEDDPMVRDVCVHMLEKKGYTVLAAADGEDALRIFRENQDSIELVVLDLVMPRLSGRKLLDRIRAICPEVRFLFVSGYNMDVISTEFSNDNRIAVIRKPYESAEILKRARELLDIR